MKKRYEEKGLIEYGVLLVGWGLLVVHLYRALAFRSVPGLTVKQSELVFWGSWALVLAGFLFLTPGYGRNGASVFVAVNSAVSVYFILSHFRLYRTAILVALLLTGAALAAYIGLVLALNLPAIRSGRLRGRLGRFIKGFFHRSGMIVSLGLSVLFLAFFVNIFLGYPLLEPRTVATDPKVNSQRIADNIDTILLLQEEQWAALDARQRLEVLQTVANIEATYLGLPHELNVEILTLDEITEGHYDDRTHTIAINADHLTEDTAHAVVETVAHEAYHAYEWRLVDLYNNAGNQARNLLIFRRIEEYSHNFENYIQGDEDYLGYVTQAVETDSVLYSESAVEDYYEAIEEYLSSAREP